MEKDCCIVYKSAFHLYKNIQDQYTYVYLTFTCKFKHPLTKIPRKALYRGTGNNKIKCLHK